MSNYTLSDKQILMNNPSGDLDKRWGPWSDLSAAKSGINALGTGQLTTGVMFAVGSGTTLTFYRVTNPSATVWYEELINVNVTGSTTIEISGGKLEIKDGSITTAKIKLDGFQVDSAQIKDGAVITAKLSDGAVTTDKVGADAIDNSKLADNAVQTENIKAGEVKSANIGTGEVKETNIGTGAVTTDKLGATSVTHAKLAADSVETNNIKDDSVTNAKVADDAIHTSQIADYDPSSPSDPKGITTSKLADNAVTSEKIKPYDATPTTGNEGVKKEHLNPNAKIGDGTDETKAPTVELDAAGLKVTIYDGQKEDVAEPVTEIILNNTSNAILGKTIEDKVYVPLDSTSGHISAVNFNQLPPTGEVIDPSVKDNTWASEEALTRDGFILQVTLDGTTWSIADWSTDYTQDPHKATAWRLVRSAATGTSETDSLEGSVATYSSNGALQSARPVIEDFKFLDEEDEYSLPTTAAVQGEIDKLKSLIASGAICVDAVNTQEQVNAIWGIGDEYFDYHFGLTPPDKRRKRKYGHSFRIRRTIDNSTVTKANFKLSTNNHDDNICHSVNNVTITEDSTTTTYDSLVAFTNAGFHCAYKRSDAYISDFNLSTGAHTFEFVAFKLGAKATGWSKTSTTLKLGDTTYSDIILNDTTVLTAYELLFNAGYIGLGDAGTPVTDVGNVTDIYEIERVPSSISTTATAITRVTIDGTSYTSADDMWAASPKLFVGEAYWDAIPLGTIVPSTPFPDLNIYPYVTGNYWRWEPIETKNSSATLYDTGYVVQVNDTTLGWVPFMDWSQSTNLDSLRVCTFAYDTGSSAFVADPAITTWPVLLEDHVGAANPITLGTVTGYPKIDEVTFSATATGDPRVVLTYEKLSTTTGRLTDGIANYADITFVPNGNGYTITAYQDYAGMDVQISAVTAPAVIYEETKGSIKMKTDDPTLIDYVTIYPPKQSVNVLDKNGCIVSSEGYSGQQLYCNAPYYSAYENFDMIPIPATSVDSKRAKINYGSLVTIAIVSGKPIIVSGPDLVRINRAQAETSDAKPLSCAATKALLPLDVSTLFTKYPPQYPRSPFTGLLYTDSDLRPLPKYAVVDGINYSVSSNPNPSGVATDLDIYYYFKFNGVSIDVVTNES